MTPYLNSLTPTCLYNFHFATMTIKGSLRVSFLIVKAFLKRNFLSPSKIGKKLAFWGEMGSKCKIFYLGPPKGTSLRETTLFDILIMKIGAGVLAVGRRKKQKKLAESLDAHFHICGGRKGVIVS